MKNASSNTQSDEFIYDVLSLDAESSSIVKDEITKFYTEILTAESVESVDEPPSLRPSSLPVCSFTSLLQISNYYLTGEKHRKYVSDFFMGVGTQVHEILDKWCDASNYKIWGNWRCSDERRCDKKWEYTDNSICPKCGSNGIYEEIEIVYRGMKGHIDCILITDKGVIVIDYKTANSYKAQLKNFRDMGVPHYPLQLFTYAYMLDKVYGGMFRAEYGKNVIGCGLLFISRDNPTRYRVFSWGRKYALKSGKALLKTGCERWTAAKKSFSFAKVTNDCVKRRLCRNKKDYLDNKKSFFPFGGCPLYSICVGKEDDFQTIRDYFKTNKFDIIEDNLEQSLNELGGQDAV